MNDVREIPILEAHSIWETLCLFSCGFRLILSRRCKNGPAQLGPGMFAFGVPCCTLWFLFRPRNDNEWPLCKVTTIRHRPHSM